MTGVLRILPEAGFWWEHYNPAGGGVFMVDDRYTSNPAGGGGLVGALQTLPEAVV